MGKKRIALVAVIGMALVFGASASATIDASFTAHTAATAGDCNGNGIGDFSEAAWAYRDDDGDGFCNGIDLCPREATAVNDGSACQMQAVAVPADPTDPAAPHVTYSGATITLKGVARYGGNQFMWDYGDGSAAMAWTAFANPYDLGVRHTYVGSVGTTYTATLSVRSSANPAVVAKATYPVEIEDANGNTQSLTTAQFDVRRRMAIDDGLWYLHKNLTRATYNAGAPGYAQPYGYWSGSPYRDCLTIDAFEQNGSLPSGQVSTDPYVEDVQRGLGFVLANTSVQPITAQPFGSPDVNGNGKGLTIGDQTGAGAAMATGRCLMALADSHAGSLRAPTGVTDVGGRTFADVAQDMVDWLAWAQEDSGNARGGWGYYGNSGSANNEVNRWPILGLGAAEASLGATVPPFVRQQAQYWLTASRYGGLNDLNGGAGDFSANDGYDVVSFTAGAIIGDEFLGNPAAYPSSVASEGFVFRHWNDDDHDWHTNLGDSDAMYSVTRAMAGAAPSQARLKAYDYTTGRQASAGFDWFHNQPGQSEQGIGTNLLLRQAADGSWTDSTGNGGGYTTGPMSETAEDVAILVLGGAVTSQPPHAAVSDVTAAVNTPVQLDASASSDSDGDPLTYAWDLNNDGQFNDASGATPTYTFAQAGDFPIAVKVTSIDGTSTAYAVAHVGGHAPVASAGGPYTATPGQSIVLDASASSDPQGLPVTYAWDLDGNGTFNDSNAAKPNFTAGNVPAGTVYTVCVKVTNSTGGSNVSCSTVTVVAAIQPPVAQIVSPFVVVSGPLPRTVLLDASRSSDPQGRSLTFNWTVTGGGTVQNPTDAIATFTVAHYGSYSATVTVGNGLLSSSATAQVQVLDKTPPSFTAPPQNITLQAGPTTAASVNAWLASVTAADDNPDFPAVALGNDFVPNSGIGGVGAGNTVKVTWTATDSAGNSAQASATVTVVGDSTPPVVTPVVTGTRGDNDWYTSDVHVSWQVTDPDSAISAQTGCADANVTSDTDTAGRTFTCSATSGGGTTTSSVTVKRDATPPTISASRTPAPNAAGWNADDVTVTYTCGDALSGLAQCSSPTVLHEGAAQSATGTARDNAGNTASATADGINVDKTGPSLTGAPASPANINGWYRADVPVHWTCSDALSGVDGCPADTTISGEGAGLTSTASVTDRAGNATAAVSAPSVQIDRTPPATSASAPSGWSNSGVTVTLSATDNLSGVATTYSSLDGGPATYGNTVAIDAEGTHTLTYWSVDKADNVEATKSVTVEIDRTAPTITHVLTPTPNAAGWNNTDVRVSFTCGDSLSGIAFCTPLQLLTAEGANEPVAGQARDAAGNTASDSATVSIDKTAPAVNAAADRAPNAAGWYAADVVVSFTCSDGLSGVAACPAPMTVHEGAAQSANGAATDVAGNSGSATLAGLNVDETAPTVTYSGNAGAYSIAQTVSITCAASDALSGVASTTCADISGPASSFGLGTTSRSASATDRAGNTGTGSVSFTVSATCGALKTVIGQWVSSADVASSLQAKVDAICSAPNANAKSGKLGAFDNQVAAQTGKTLTAHQGDLLEQFAGTL